MQSGSGRIDDSARNSTADDHLAGEADHVEGHSGGGTSGGVDREDEEEQGTEHAEAEMESLCATLRERGYRERGVDPQPVPLVSSFDLRGVAEYMESPRCQNIVVMCGAGISVSAGIPDFRTPGTGLYDNLRSYDLPSPQSIFEIEYFREKPDAFYRLCAELWPDNFSPTLTHHFIAELHARGRLRRCFTQNIDSLEVAAGLPASMTVAAHGNFDRCSCIDTGVSVDVEEVRTAIAHGKHGPAGWLAMAERHGGLVKPDIVFFGEQLPARFFDLAEPDFAQCDLLIILGTSLKVRLTTSSSAASEPLPRPRLHELSACHLAQYRCTRSPLLSALCETTCRGCCSTESRWARTANLSSRCSGSSTGVRLTLTRYDRTIRTTSMALLMFWQYYPRKCLANCVLASAQPVPKRARVHWQATRYRDVCFIGDCDQGLRELAAHLDRLAAEAAVVATEAAPSKEAMAMAGQFSGDGGWMAALDRRLAEQPPPAAPFTQPAPDTEPAAPLVASSESPRAYGVRRPPEGSSDAPLPLVSTSGSGAAHHVSGPSLKADEQPSKQQRLEW